MIGSCDNCTRMNVPIMKGSFCGAETQQCYVCNGDIEDPYGELEEADDSAEERLGRKLDSVIRESRSRPMHERIDLILAELDEFCILSLNPETVDLINPYKPMIGMALRRCKLIMEILLAQQPPKFKVISNQGSH